MLKKIHFNNKFNEIIKIKKLNNYIFVDISMLVSNYTKLTAIKTLKNFFTYTFIMYFLHITWRGKAYRVRLFKKNSKFTVNFGHSHWYKILFKSNYFKFFRIRRQNYLVFFRDRQGTDLIKKIFSNIRQFNKYTRRGIRLKKSIFIKRFGKISQVNSILHSF